MQQPLVFDFANLSPRDRYKLLIGAVVPRPIALVTSCDVSGRVNAAPFSFFNVFSEEPAQIVLGLQHKLDGSHKDTTRNLRVGRYFTVNMVDEPLARTMSDCAIEFPSEMSEVESLGIETQPGTLVPVPRLSAAPIALECRVTMSMAFSTSRELLIGEVLGVIARADLVDVHKLYIDPDRYRPIGRLAGNLYCRLSDVFEITRPTFADWARGQEAPHVDVRRDDLTGEPIRQLIARHLRGMHENSPPESVHALDIEKLREPTVSVWSAWVGEALVGCGALKRIDDTNGEIKSMRVVDDWRGKGVGRAVLTRIIADARHAGLTTLWLETGSTADFAPALRLYESAGFVRCGPFGTYVTDPFSIFMTRSLEADGGSF